MKKLGNVLIEVMQDLSRISTNGSAHVKINSHVCPPEQFEHLFNYFAQGTILERIDLRAEAMHSQVDCVCGYDAKVKDPEHKSYCRCPECGRFANIKSDEYKLVSPDPENANLRQSIRF